MLNFQPFVKLNVLLFYCMRAWSYLLISIH